MICCVVQGAVVVQVVGIVVPATASGPIPAPLAGPGAALSASESDAAVVSVSPATPEEQPTPAAAVVVVVVVVVVDDDDDDAVSAVVVVVFAGAFVDDVVLKLRVFHSSVSQLGQTLALHSYSCTFYLQLSLCTFSLPHSFPGSIFSSL